MRFFPPCGGMLMNPGVNASIRRTKVETPRFARIAASFQTIRARAGGDFVSPRKGRWERPFFFWVRRTFLTQVFLTLGSVTSRARTVVKGKATWHEALHESPKGVEARSASGMSDAGGDANLRHS